MHKKTRKGSREKKDQNVFGGLFRSSQINTITGVQRGNRTKVASRVDGGRKTWNKGCNFIHTGRIKKTAY